MNVARCPVCRLVQSIVIKYLSESRHFYSSKSGPDYLSMCQKNAYGLWLVTSCSHRIHYFCHYNTVNFKIQLKSIFIMQAYITDSHFLAEFFKQIWLNQKCGLYTV